MGKSADTMFLRNATGLVREMGLVGAILFGLTYSVQIFAGPCCLVPYWVSYGDYAGNFWLAIAIALVAALLINSVYAHFSSAMPRSGGDYVFLSRTMHPLLGFAPSWSFVSIASTWNAFNLLFFAVTVPLFLSPFFSPDALAALSTPSGIFALGMILWLFGMITMTGMKWFSRLQVLAWIIQAAGIGICGYFMLSAAGVFPTLFNNWARQYVPTVPDMYHTIMNQAVAAGFNPNPPPEGPTMSSTLAFAAVVLGEAVPYQAGIIWIAGEVKKAESGVRQHIAMETGCLLAFGLGYVAGSLIWILSAGPQFLGAFLWLGGTVSGASALPINSWIWSIAPVLMPTWAVSLFGLGCMMAAVVVYMVGVMVVSRIIFAWSFDRMIPSIFAQVSEKYKTPYVGLLVASVFSIVLYVFEIFAPQYTFFGALSFFVLINVFIVTICGMVFPFVRKDMFELMPLKARIAGIPLLSIISFFGLLLTCLVSTAYFTNPNFMISFGVTYNAVGYAAAIWIIGMIYYFADRAYNKRRGINLDIAFKQIPPA